MVSSDVIVPESTPTVYFKSNALCTPVLHGLCTVPGVAQTSAKEDPVTRFALDLAFERKGWDQAQFAEKMGLTKAAVTNWLSRRMPGKYYVRVGELLGCTAEELARAGTPGKGPRESTKVIFGVELSPEAAHFAAEWMALRSPLRAQFQAMVQSLVQEQARDARKHNSVDVREPLHRRQST